MTWYLLLKLAHIVCVIALMAGLIGRGLTRLQMPKIDSLPTLQEVMVLVGRPLRRSARHPRISINARDWPARWVGGSLALYRE